jgi:hypothetical protein
LSVWIEPALVAEWIRAMKGYLASQGRPKKRRSLSSGHAVDQSGMRRGDSTKIRFGAAGAGSTLLRLDTEQAHS